MVNPLVLYSKFDEIVNSQKYIQLISTTPKISTEIDLTEAYNIIRFYNLYNEQGIIAGHEESINNVYVSNGKINRTVTYTSVIDNVGTIISSVYKDNLFTPYTNKPEITKNFISKTGEFEFTDVTEISEILSDNTRKKILLW
jgi:hypothetical protein